MENKIQQLLARCSEVEAQLGDPNVFNDQKRYKALSQEHAYLRQIRQAWQECVKLRGQLVDNQELLEKESDPEFLKVLQEDSAFAKEKLEKLEKTLEELLIPPDPDDHCNTILELRAGTGGEEAALFVADCVRMYQYYAGKKGWRCEQLSASASERGGYKEYIMVLLGPNVHRLLQYEGGTHRVQRVPATEAQGRIHTSAITIAVLLEPREEEEIRLDEKDLRIETCRSSGAGGQHVNTTDSAVRIVHIPTDIVAQCQDERSQQKNKEKALRMLKAKILQHEREKKEAAIASKRAQQVGSGDRSERIRTYNFPQNRVTDHRIGVTKYNLDRMMEGEMDEIILPLVSHFYQLKLQAPSS